jgi:hypothetical protein
MPRSFRVLTLVLAFVARSGVAGADPVPPATAAPVPPPCAPRTTGPVEVEGAGPKVTVHVEGPPPDLTLLRSAPPYGWRWVCQAPCTAHAPLDAEYKLRGSGVTESESFHLDPKLGSVQRVRVEPVSQGALIAGTILIYAGVSVLPSGALMIASGYVTDKKPLVTIGFITLGVGTALTGVGLPLFFANTKSDVSIERAARNQPEPRAIARLPVSAERAARGVEVPLLSGSF